MIVHVDENGDAVCEHGVAVDVHCCNCHSGFLFDMNWCKCIGGHSVLTPEEIHERYFYHKPTPRAAELHDKVNNMLEQVALTLEEILPEGRQKALSHTALEEVRFRANASIAQNHDKL